MALLYLAKKSRSTVLTHEKVELSQARTKRSMLASVKLSRYLTPAALMFFMAISYRSLYVLYD